MKINKIKMLISTVIIFIPSLITLTFSDSLNERIAIHWGINGTPDGYASPLYFALFMPTLLAIFQWLCVFISIKTNSKNQQSKKVIEIIYWICPAISIISSTTIYLAALGSDINIYSIMSVAFGVMFIIIGNYMPKCKQNATMGIKLKWTLTNEENWNVTHRLAGKVWFYGGLLFFPAALLPTEICAVFSIASLLVFLLVPTVYSYIYYRKQIKFGGLTKEDFTLPKASKKARIIAIILVSAILIGVSVLMFTGSISVVLTESSISVDATYWDEKKIDYNDIAEIRFTESDEGAVRLNGFGSARLMLGWFTSDKEGDHTRYTYTSCGSAVIITTKDGTKYIINKADENLTGELYEELSARLSRSEG